MLMLKLCFMLGSAGGHFDACQQPECIQSPMILWEKAGPGWPLDLTVTPHPTQIQFEPPALPQIDMPALPVNYPVSVRTGRYGQVRWVVTAADPTRACLAKK